MIIGITGPAGAGKDEVAKILKRRGAQIINADEVGHSILSSNKALCRDLIAIFGSGIEKKDGSIDREKLGKIVFNDLVKLKELNHIMHPLMVEEIRQRIQAAKGRSGKEGKLIVINAAVLDEMGLRSLCNQVWVVMASAQKRLKRLVKQRKISKAFAQKIIHAQRSKEEYLQIADKVIDNEKSLRDQGADIFPDQANL